MSSPVTDTGPPAQSPWQRTKAGLAAFWDESSFVDDTSFRDDVPFQRKTEELRQHLRIALAFSQALAVEDGFPHMAARHRAHVADPSPADWFADLPADVQAMVRDYRDWFIEDREAIAQANDRVDQSAPDWFASLSQEGQHVVQDAFLRRLGWFLRLPEIARTQFLKHAAIVVEQIERFDTPLAPHRRWLYAIGLFLSLAYPYVIAGLVDDWVFLVGSGSAIPRSVLMGALIMRFGPLTAHLALEFWDDRLWFNVAPALFNTPKAILKLLGKPMPSWSTAPIVVASLLLLFAVSFTAQVLHRRTMSKIKTAHAEFDDADRENARGFSLGLDTARRRLIEVREAVRDGRNVTKVSVPMRRATEVISTNVSAIREIIAAYAPPSAHDAAAQDAPPPPMFTRKSKAFPPGLVVVALAVQAYLISDQVMALVSLVGKQIWVLIKQIIMVFDPYVAPSVLLEKTATTFIGNIPSFFGLMIPHRAMDGNFLTSITNISVTFLVLTIFKTFFSNHFIPFIQGLIGFVINGPTAAYRWYVARRARPAPAAPELPLTEQGSGDRASAQATGSETRTADTRRKAPWMTHGLD